MTPWLKLRLYERHFGMVKVKVKGKNTEQGCFVPTSCGQNTELFLWW